MDKQKKFETLKNKFEALIEQRKKIIEDIKLLRQNIDIKQIDETVKKLEKIYNEGGQIYKAATDLFTEIGQEKKGGITEQLFNFIPDIDKFGQDVQNDIKQIKQQQPKQQPKQQKQEQQRVDTCYHLHDFAPPASMIYTPCGDYIAPPQKCCRFFIENRHCFLRSADNACIDPITKEVFGFWNCEIGKKCELLPPPPTDDDQNDDDHDDHVQLDINNDDFNKIDALAMRKKSDANRARITGQPVALLRQKIATKYGMLWRRR